jgi:hypothetical protein
LLPAENDKRDRRRDQREQGRPRDKSNQRISPEEISQVSWCLPHKSRDASKNRHEAHPENRAPSEVQQSLQFNSEL